MAKRLKEAEMVGMHIYEWDIIEYVGNHKLKCRCSCGKIKTISKYDILDGRSKCCGHTRREDLTGQKVGEWKVIKYIGNLRYLCECSCGEVREVLAQSLKNGGTSSCGHEHRLSEQEIQSIIGTHIGEWEILEYIDNYKYKCRCSCGEIREISRYALLNGTSKSCGHNYNKLIDLTDKVFGELTVKKYLQHGYWLCQCSCGKDIIRPGKMLRMHSSTSCGHTIIDKAQSNSLIERTDEQKKAVLSKRDLENFINSLNKKVDLKELSELLGITYPHTVRLINNFNLQDRILKRSNTSYMEDEVYNYIMYLEPKLKVIRNIRKLLKNSSKEIDLYIPDKKLAIEFNGNYWHSVYVLDDKKYHQDKTLDLAKQGIRLIHIFEYEWNNEDTQRKIKSLLKSVILGNSNRIYARNTTVESISIADESIFCEKYHIQGSSKSSIKLGLKYNDEIVSIMSFGLPRFESNNQYELIRYCCKEDTSIIGGAEKLFKYFLNNYNPSSIITYTDISKFTGNVYSRLGFRVIEFTQPNYKWVSPGKVEHVLSRYQTQKQKLIDKGLGTPDQTEDEIMEELGYLKIYDAGNLKLVWERQ